MFSRNSLRCCISTVSNCFTFCFRSQSYSSSSGGSVSSISSSQKRMDDSGARFTNANFQEVPSHSSASSKDGGSSERESKSSEGKSKKSSSHSSSSSSSGSRGRKSNPSKSHGPVVTIATSSTVPSSTSPFQQGEAWFGLYHAQLKKATTIKCES